MARVWFDIIAWMQISAKLSPVEGQIRKSFTCRLGLISLSIIPWILLRRWLLLNLHFVVVRRGQFLHEYLFPPPPHLTPPPLPQNAAAYQAISTYFCFPLISPSLKSTVAHRTPQQTPCASRQQMQFLRANGTNRHRGVFKGKNHTDHFPAEKKRDSEK